MSTTKPVETTISKVEEITTKQEEDTTGYYGDTGEDWIVEGSSNRVYIKGYMGIDTDIIMTLYGIQMMKFMRRNLSIR